jgi:hypothetical protein
MEIGENEKFGIVVVSDAFVENLPKEVELSEDTWVTCSIPFEVDDNWRDWIGSIQSKRIEKSNLFIISKAPSNTPKVLDGENQRLQDKAYKVYFGLLLTDYFHTYDRPIQLTGSKWDIGIDVRSIGVMDSPYSVPGTPINRIDQMRLERSKQLADAIDSLPSKGRFSRFKKVIRSFYSGITSNLVEDRIHQFVRSIEGFINPNIGKTERQFKSRTELFVGPKHHQLMEELYRIRSAVEHLHDPLEGITGSDFKDKLIYLFKKAYEIEAVSRYCISRLLFNKKIWPFFEDDESLSNFWKKDINSRKSIWGATLDIEKISQSFNEELISPNDLDVS